MSGAMPGKIMTGTRTVPCDELTSTRSPCASRSRSAVCGLTSTQLLHIAEVNGSGSSCSHGRCALDPSPNCNETQGRRWNGYVAASPSNCGSTYFIADCGLRIADWIVDCGLAGVADFATSSAVFQGSATGVFSLPASSISTSAVA